MFRRKTLFRPDGFYDAYGYRAVGKGQIDVDMGGRIVRFNSIEEMIEALERSSAPIEPNFSKLTIDPPSIPVTEQYFREASPPLPPLLRKKKKGNGCGCFTIIVIAFALFYFLSGNSDGAKIADIINLQFGQVCEAKVEGAFSNTLRLDWTAATTKMNVIVVMAAIGKSKETLYSKGIRYLKFPNDAGGYNIIDWKSGEKSSVNEAARYYFRN
jgi:hypothetical protein